MNRRTFRRLLTAALLCAACAGCFEKVSSSTDYVLRPLVQPTSGALASPLGGVVAYAFDADTAAWGVDSYDDALAGILTAKEGGERIETPLAEAQPCEAEGMTDRLAMTLPARPVMVLAVDTEHRLYAYTQQQLAEGLGSLYVDLTFKPWRETTSYVEKWSFYNPFYVPAPKLECLLRITAQRLDGADEESVPSVKGYAFAADTTEWRIASYDDALSGILTSKLDPAVTRDNPEFNAYETNEADTYRLTVDRPTLMLVVVDRTHRRYAYVQQRVELTGEPPRFGVVFRLWREAWIYEEQGWRVVDPERAPAAEPEPDPTEPAPEAPAGNPAARTAPPQRDARAAYPAAGGRADRTPIRR